jgi:hypothetical protein
VIKGDGKFIHEHDCGCIRCHAQVFMLDELKTITRQNEELLKLLRELLTVEYGLAKKEPK